MVHFGKKKRITATHAFIYRFGKAEEAEENIRLAISFILGYADLVGSLTSMDYLSLKAGFNEKAMLVRL